MDLDVARAGVGRDVAQPLDAFRDAKRRVGRIGHGINRVNLTAGGVGGRVHKHAAAGGRRVDLGALENHRPIGRRDRWCGRVNAVIGRGAAGGVARQSHVAAGRGDAAHAEEQTIGRSGVTDQLDVTGRGDVALPSVLSNAVVTARTRDVDGARTRHNGRANVGGAIAGVVVQPIHHNVAGVGAHALGGRATFHHGQIKPDALHRYALQGDVALGTQQIGGAVQGDAPRNTRGACAVVYPTVGITGDGQIAVEAADDLVRAPHQHPMAIACRAVHAGRGGIGINVDSAIGQDGGARSVHAQSSAVSV